jgi:tetratricopeptide (TPR) repeat protein
MKPQMNTDEHRSAPLPRGSLLLFVAVPAIGAFNLWRYSGYLLDDTFISLRYAKNLVEGHGLVFNRGEYVEGYTNFSFVLLAAAFIRAGIDPIIGTKAVVAAATLWMLVLLVRLEALGPRVARASWSLPIVILWLLPLEAFAYWATASFETNLFAALLLWALWLGLREAKTGRWRGAALVFVLLALTRPEGVFLFFVCTAACTLAGSARPFRARVAVPAINTILFLLLFGAYFIWRYAYYGDLLPNTFRAKVTGGWEQLVTGVRYGGRWALAFPFFAVTLLLPLLFLNRGMRKRIELNRAMIAVYLVALAYAGYVVGVGGDFMPYFRFFVPLMPLCALLLSWTLASLTKAPLFSKGGSSKSGIVVAAVLSLHIGFSIFTEEPYRAFVAHRTAVVGGWVGQRLALDLASDDLIAVNTAGSLPYYSERPAVDMLGLTDPDIARRPVFIVSPGWAGHRRGWGEYVLNRRPRVIFFYNSSGAREPFYLSDHELADDPYFRFFYRPKAFALVARGDPARAVERFLGFPFGFEPSGRAAWRDLGLDGEFRRWFLPYTVFFEGEMMANYFELDARDEALWPLRGTRDEVGSFLTAVTAQWRARVPAAEADPGDRARVERLCAEAYAKLQANDRTGAKRLLSEAVRLNGRVRSPLVYQYVANVAVLDGDLFTAVNAQKEALRLAPDNALYRSNLRSLLTTPYREAARVTQ